MKFFEREVLCFEEELLLQFKNFIIPIVQQVSFKNFILPIGEKKRAPKNTLKNLYYGEYEKISFY